MARALDAGLADAAALRPAPPDGAASAVAEGRSSLVLHLGAHRTGSTSAQRALAARAEAAGAGFRFLGPRATRPGLTWALHALGAAPGLDTLASPLLLRLVAPGAAASVAAREAAPLVVSDEIFLGPLAGALLDPRGLYPEARRRLRALRRMLGGRPVRPVIALRPYAGWFASAYAFTLTRRALPAPGPLAAAWAARPRGWSEIVAEIVEVFGACEAADLAAPGGDPAALLRRLAPGWDGAPPPHVGRAPTGPAVEALIRLRAGGARPGPEAIRAALRDHLDGPPFDPFAPDIRAALDRRYERDLERIARLGALVAARTGPDDQPTERNAP